MIARILSKREEWACITAPELAPSLPYLREGKDDVMVVEDESGRIVASWAIVETLNLHGCNIDPSVAGKSEVIFAGLAAMKRRVRERGFTCAQTSAATPFVHALCRSLKAERVPGDAYVLSVED